MDSQNRKDAGMAFRSSILAFVLAVLTTTGCNTLVGKKMGFGSKSNAIVKDSEFKTKTLAIPASFNRDSSTPDRAAMIPPPPDMEMPAIPEAPPKEDRIGKTPLPTSDVPGEIVPVSAKSVAPRSSTNDTPIAEKGIDAVKRLHSQAAQRFQNLDGFEATLVRREVVASGRSMPEETIQYRYRREPHSVHLKWIGLENQGREMVFVNDKPDAKVTILSGRNEGMFVAAGKRWTFAPTDNTIRSKARHDIRDSGMGMSIVWMGKVLAQIDRDPSQVNRLRYIGRKERLERKTGLDAIEERIPPGWEPLLPQGGQRTTYFDPDAASPSFGLPILVVTLDSNGKEVEYYWFDKLNPFKPTNADFDPDKIWKK
jgi:hypothetical protein